MKKIDSYILRKYLGTFFFCLLLFTAIVVVVDMSEKADDFVYSKLSVWGLITNYYFGFIPRIDAMLFPLFVFIAVIYFTSKMADKSEVIAILSSGVSLRRMLLPYWIGGIFLAMLLWGVYHLVLPGANEIWTQFQTKYVERGRASNDDKTFPKNFYFRIDSNTYASIRYYDTTSKTGGNFFIQQFENNRLKYNVRAENFSWDTTRLKWRLGNVLERTFKGEQEEVHHKSMMYANYNFKPRDLRRDEYLKDRLTTPELNELIRMEKLRGSENINSLLVERYNRDAIPVSVIILTIIGAVTSSRKVRGGSGFHLAVGVVLSVLYILSGRFSLVFATKGNFTPWLAAWIPNMIFGILAYYFYKRAAR